MGPEVHNAQEKPAVLIYVRKPENNRLIHPILLGLEEEGIPWKVCSFESQDLYRLAKQAADDSRLDVGLGIDSQTNRIFVQHIGLSAEKPLLVYDSADSDHEIARQAGENAARLVKRQPLLLNTPVSSQSEQLRPGGEPKPGENPDPLRSDEESIDLIKRIVTTIIELNGA